MDIKEKIKKILEQEMGITTPEQLEEAYENMDMSLFGIFAPREGEHTDAA